MDRIGAQANNSPSLIVDPLDARFVVMPHRMDAPAFDCGLEVSGDGGRGWLSASPVPTLPTGADRCYAAEAAFGPDGTLYFLFVGLTGPGNRPMGVFLTESRDDARSFDEPHQVLGPANFSVRMAVQQNRGRSGRIHLAWLHASTEPATAGLSQGPNPILTSHSDDGGNHFSPPIQVSGPDRARVVAPGLAVGSGGAVHIVYYDLGDDAVDYQGLEGGVWGGTWSLVLSSSRDSGDHFSTSTVVNDSVVPSARVMLIFTMPPPSVAAGRGLVCVGWSDSSLGDPDSFARCSSNGGRQFRKTARLNDDSPGTGKSQYEPQLSIAPSGRIDAIFYDRRASLQNLQNDVSFTYSTDRGRTFRPNVQLNHDGSSSVRIGPEYAVASARGQVEFGSQLGLISTGKTALAAWTDTRNSLELTTDQDIFTTEVMGLPASHAAGASTLSISRVLLSAAIVCCSLLVLLLERRRADAGTPK